MNSKIYEYFYELRIFIGIAWSDDRYTHSKGESNNSPYRTLFNGTEYKVKRI